MPRVLVRGRQSDHLWKAVNPTTNLSAGAGEAQVLTERTLAGQYAVCQQHQMPAFGGSIGGLPSVASSSHWLLGWRAALWQRSFCPGKERSYWAGT